MKSVLIIAADFAPSSLPTSQRVRLFANYLVDEGWDVVVVAPRGDAYEQQVDPENDNLLDVRVEVIRSRAIPFRFTRRFRFGDVGLRSAFGLLVAANQRVHRKPVSVVLVCIPPNVVAAIAPVLSWKARVPFVVDYGDPWFSDYYLRGKGRARSVKQAAANAIAFFLERRVAQRAAGFSSVSEGTLTPIQRAIPEIRRRPRAVIPFGYDQKEIDYIRRHPRRNPLFDPDDGRIHLCYVGAIAQHMVPVVETFLRAFARVVEHETPGRLRLHLVGTSYAPRPDESDARMVRVIRELRLESSVFEYPARVPYLTALQILLDSAGGIIFGGTQSHYTASKVFPYIVTRKPTLVFANADSSLAEIARDARMECVTFRSDERLSVELVDLESAIARLIRDAKTRVVLPALPPSMSAYSAATMAQRLGQLLDEVITSHE